METPPLSRTAWNVAFLFFPFGPFLALRFCRAISTLQCVLGLLVALTFHAGLISVLAKTNGQKWQIFVILLLGVTEFSLGGWHYLPGLRASLWTPAAMRTWRLAARFFGGLLTLFALVSILSFHMERLTSASASAPEVSIAVRDNKFAVLESFDFTTGEWEAEIHIDSADFPTLDKRVPRAATLYTNDRALLTDMRRTWIFKKTSGDVATVTSSFTLKKDGHPVFDCGIVLDGHGGLQSRQFGWAPAMDENGFFGPVSRFQF